MKEDRPLHEMFERYAAGGIDRPRLEGEIFTFISSHPWRYKLASWNVEEREDFTADLYPIIRKTIDAYRNTGACFDAYVYSAVRWEALAFRCRKSETAAMERAYWRTMRAETTYDDESPYEAEESDPAREGRGEPIPRKKRQILALSLKCCLFVSSDFCRRIAPAVGMEAAELETKMGQLREKIAARTLRRRDLEERAAAQYYRSVVMEAKAGSAAVDGARRLKYEKSAALARKRHEKLRSKAASVSLEPTNREVADSLGVPKGTVDASLFFLKRRSAPLPDTPPRRL